MCFALASCAPPADPPTAIPSAETFRGQPFNIGVGDNVEKVNGAAVNDAFFHEAKIQPLLGRLFLDPEYKTADARVVVLGASLWQRRFGSDPAVLGETLMVDRQACTVVGILPKTFHFPADSEIWIPRNK